MTKWPEPMSSGYNTDHPIDSGTSSVHQGRQTHMKWGLSILFTLSLITTLLFFNLFWLTLHKNASLIVGYTVAQLAEVEQFLDTSYDDMVKYAKANPEGNLELLEFPVSLTLRCADVAGMSKSELRAHILREASKTIYFQGWAAQSESKGEGSYFLKWSVLIANFLGHKGHRWLRILLPIAAICSVLLAVAYAHFSRGRGKLIGLGTGFSAASLLSLLTLVTTTFAVTNVSSNLDDPFLLSLLELATILLRILQRSYIVFFSLGLAFIAQGFIANMLLRRLHRPT